MLYNDCLLFFFFFFYHGVCGILVPRTEIKCSLHWEQSLNHWITNKSLLDAFEQLKC